MGLTRVARYVFVGGLTLMGVLLAEGLASGAVPAISGALFVPVAVVAFLFGRVYGLAATALAIAALVLRGTTDVMRLGLVAVNGIVASELIGSLHRSRSQLRTMFDASPLPSLLVRMRDQTVAAANDAFIAALGYTRDDLQGLRDTTAHRYTDSARMEEILKLVAREGSAKNIEIEARHKDGRKRTLLVSVQRVEVRGEAHAIVVFDDITDQRATEQCFRRAFDSSPLPHLMIRASDRRFVAVNDTFVRTFGYTRDEILARTLDDVGAYLDHADRERMLAVLEADGKLAEQPLRMRTRTGVVRDVVVSVVSVTNDGEPTLLCVMRDVTEAKRTAATLAASERRLATVFRSNPLPAGIVRLSDRMFLDVNDAYVRTFGFARDELVGHCADDVSIFVDPEERARLIRRAAETGSSEPLEVSCRTKTGQHIDALWSIELMEIDGEPAILGVFQDVTERKRQLASLQESAAKYSAVFMLNPLPTVLIRMADRTFVSVNEAFAELFGYRIDELVGRSTDESSFYMNAADRGRAYKDARVPGALRARETKLKTKAGKPLDVLVSGEVIDLDGEPHLMGVFNDITARTAMEAALRESEQRFRDLAEHTQEVFWISSPDLARIQYVSPAFEQVWGRPCASLYASASLWYDVIVPDDRERVRQAALNDHDYNEQYRIILPDGTLRWIFDRGTVVRDESGAVLRRVGVAKDMTAHVQLEEQLRQTQKLESLGLLAGGVAHDFNNVLAVIASCASLLGEGSSPEEVRELVAEIDHAVHRATALTRQLLAFSRKQVSEPKVIDINVAVNETRKMLRRMLGEDILLTTSLQPDLQRVRIDPGHFVQVLMNLAVNARDAMPRGGNLSITTRHASSGTIELSVEDTGSGIAPEVVERIFEPFFTTKGLGKGTGMGLAVVHGIVEQAGGSIAVESTPGVGTRFRIYLPVVEAAADPLPTVQTAMAVGKETILIVDDDDHVRRVAARALRARGFEVIEASDAQAALGHLDTPSPIDLLLTDVVMPGMDGRQLAEAARGRLPDLKILYTSGYTDDAVVRHGVSAGEVDLLEKPFRLDTLATKVRTVLDC